MSGTLTVHLEYGCELRDVQWFGRQDPYCLLHVGPKTLRSRTHNNGGRNPVWNQSFQFSLLHENDLSITVRDQEVMADSHIGVGHASLARVRATGSDRQQVPIVSRWGRTRGFVQVTLTYQGYGVGHAQPMAAPFPAPYPHAQPYAAPYAGPHAAPHACGCPAAYAPPHTAPYAMPGYGQPSYAPHYGTVPPPTMLY